MNSGHRIAVKPNGVLIPKALIEGPEEPSKMNQRLLVWNCAVSLSLAVAGCIPGDSGGGGGLGSFARGFAFVRERNIYVVDDSDVNASHPLALTTTGDCQNPSLSTNGRRLVFVRGPSDASELWAVNTTSGATPSLVLGADPSRANVRTPVFSPDGNTIVFAYDSGGVSYLARVNADGSGMFAQFTSSNSYTGPSFLDGSGVIAAQGPSRSTYNQIVRVPLNGTTPQPIVSSLGPEACSIANRVAVSPDGSKVAFDARTRSSGSCSGPTRIFVVNLSGGLPTRLTDYVDPATDGFPTWVGNSQVGYSSNFRGADQIYVLPASASMTSGSLKVPTASQPYYGPN